MNIYEVAQEYDELNAVFEGYVDLSYNSDRTLIVEKEVEPKDPDLVAERAVSIATRGEVEAADGTMLDIPASSICIHGDGPNSVELLETIHDRFEEEGVELARLDELV
jgi:5-oxoprolinase (ATP-hydrolysing) subunit A